MSNIEPLARVIAERVCRKGWEINPSLPPMTDSEVAAWVDTHWESAAAELESGVIDDEGNSVPGANWEFGLAAFEERMVAKRLHARSR